MKLRALFVGLLLSAPVWADITSVITFPGGHTTDVQFNDHGVFGGDDTFTFNKTTNVLTVYRLDGTSETISGNFRLAYLNCTTKTNGGKLTTDAGGNVICDDDNAGGAGTGSPGGTSNQIQFNKGGVFGGDTGLTYSSTTQSVVIGSSLTIGGVKLSHDSAVFRLTISSSAIVEGQLVVGGTNGGASAGNTTFVNSAGTTVHQLSTISNPVAFNQDTAGRDFKVGTNGGLDTLFVSASSNTVDVRGGGGLRTSYGMSGASLTIAGLSGIHRNTNFFGSWFGFSSLPPSENNTAFNFGLGPLTLNALTTGQGNTASGFSSLNVLTNGNNNTANGFNSGGNFGTSTGTVAGSSNTFYGASTGVSSTATINNSGAFGYGAQVSSSNTIQLGNHVNINTDSMTVISVSVSGIPSGQCVQTGTGGFLTGTGSACGAGGGGSGTSVYPATATASFPFGQTTSTITVTSTATLNALTFSGTGNPSFNKNGETNKYQIVGSSTGLIVGNAVVATSSMSIADAGAPAILSSNSLQPGTSIYVQIVQAQDGIYTAYMQTHGIVFSSGTELVTNSSSLNYDYTNNVVNIGNLNTNGGGFTTANSSSAFNQNVLINGAQNWVALSNGQQNTSGMNMQSLSTAGTSFDRGQVGSNLAWDVARGSWSVLNNFGTDIHGMVFKAGGSIAFLGSNSQPANTFLTEAQLMANTHLYIAGDKGLIGVGMGSNIPTNVQFQVQGSTTVRYMAYISTAVIGGNSIAISTDNEIMINGSPGVVGQYIASAGPRASPAWTTPSVGGSGGASSLAVSTGIATGTTGVITSSPTAIVNFDSGTFNVSLKGGATAYVQQTALTGDVTTILGSPAVTAAATQANIRTFTGPVTFTSSVTLSSNTYTTLASGGVLFTSGTQIVANTSLMNVDYANSIFYAPNFNANGGLFTTNITSAAFNGNVLINNAQGYLGITNGQQNSSGLILQSPSASGTGFSRALLGSNVVFNPATSLYTVSNNFGTDIHAIMYRAGGSIAFIGSNNVGPNTTLTDAQLTAHSQMWIYPDKGVYVGSGTIQPTSGFTVGTSSGANVVYRLDVGSMTGAGLSTCGDSTHALAWSSSTNQFSCQAITGTGGGSGGGYAIEPASVTVQAAAGVIISSGLIVSTQTAVIVATTTLTSSMTVVMASAPASGFIKLTLPPASANVGLDLMIYKVDGGSNTVFIQAAGSDVIEGTATIHLDAQRQHASLHSLGAAGWGSGLGSIQWTPPFITNNISNEGNFQVGVSSRVIQCPIYVQTPVAVTGWRVDAQATGSAGKVSFGIFDRNGVNMIALSTQTIVSGVNNYLLPNPIQLPPGIYKEAISMNNVTANLTGATPNDKSTMCSVGANPNHMDLSQVTLTTGNSQNPNDPHMDLLVVGGLSAN